MKPGRLLGLAGVVAALFAEGAGAAERTLTLTEAVTLALQRNEDLVIERHASTAARARLSGARGAYDPRLTLDGGWRKAREPFNSSFSGAPAGEIAAELETSEAGVSLRQLLPTGGEIALRGSGGRETTDGTLAWLSPAHATRAGVELRQPLLRDRSIDPVRLSVRVAHAGRRRAAASLRRTVTETLAAVETAYWNLASIRLGVNVREQAVRLAEEQLAETRTRVSGGVAPQSELAQPRAELERRRADLLAQREALTHADNALKLLVLSDADEAVWSESLVPVDSVALAVGPVDVAAALSRALATRAELAEREAELARRHAETAFARDGRWPALDAVVSYDRFGLSGSRNAAGSGAPVPPRLDGQLGRSFDVLGDGDFDAVRVALVLELPILNRTARAEATAARSVESQAEAALAKTRKAIRAEVLDAAARLELAGQRIEATRSGREAAEIQLSAERDRYATGLSTNFLVLTRQNDLSRARLDEISALTDYRTARTEMGRATGALIEGRGIEIEGLEGVTR